MSETYVTIVGNALTKPEKRVTEKTGVVVANFLAVANARRQDESGQWYDRSLFRIKVTCWRRMADHVADSIKVGDPIIIQGRLSTRDWTTENGEPRTNYELEATSIGHDLKYGRSAYTKARAEGLSTIEDEESQNRVQGERTRPFGDETAPYTGYDESYASSTGGAYGSSVAEETEEDALAILREAGFATGEGRPDDRDDDGGSDDDQAEEDLVGAASGSGGPAGRGRRRGR